MNVRIIKQGPTFGKTGTAEWNAKIGKWEVPFRSPWVGSYTSEEIEFIG